MALVTCKECGNKVSTKAKLCPSCGAKVKKQTSLVTWLVFVVLVLFGYAAMQGTLNRSSSSKRASTLTESNQEESETSIVQSAPRWHSFDTKDQMTGAINVYATSPRVSSKTAMEFPYSRTQAWLGVGCDGFKEWAYVGFTVAPNLNNTETKSGYSTFQTRIRWNDDVDIMRFDQEWGAKFLSFEADAIAIEKIARNRTVLLELNWHGQRTVYFEFPLTGSSAAIEEMRQSCLRT